MKANLDILNLFVSYSLFRTAAMSARSYNLEFLKVQIDILVRALVLSRLDFCNSLHAGSTISTLQLGARCSCQAAV